ncbi:unnamed protein product [Caretta caretta]
MDSHGNQHCTDDTMLNITSRWQSKLRQMLTELQVELHMTWPALLPEYGSLGEYGERGSCNGAALAFFCPSGECGAAVHAKPPQSSSNWESRDQDGSGKGRLSLASSRNMCAWTERSIEE